MIPSNDSSVISLGWQKSEGEIGAYKWVTLSEKIIRKRATITFWRTKQGAPF